MYSYISGTLEYVGEDFVVIDVNGIGYKINTPVSTINNVKVKDKVKVYTYTYVREDILALYGFLTNEELETFELLISVSGIGPKAGLALLSSVSPSKFALAIVTDDIKTLTQVPGIGAKTAKRMILELKDKIKTADLSEESPVEIIDANDNVHEAINALVVLGYSKSEATKAVKSVENTNDVEELIKMGLKKLVKY